MLKKMALVYAAGFLIVPYAVAGESPESNGDVSDKPSWIMDTSGVGRDANGVVRSDQILEIGTAPSNGLQLEGEHLMRGGDLDKALIVLQKSVEMAPLDMDKRILYSQALETKLMKQKEKSAALYNFLVKQWFFIYKNSEFADQTMQARQHIVHLCGTAPKPFEKVPKFLNRVLVPEDGSAKITLSKKTTAHATGSSL